MINSFDKCCKTHLTRQTSALGRTSLEANTTGHHNVGVGMAALEVNTTGGNNTAVGYAALVANTTASNKAKKYENCYKFEKHRIKINF